MSGGLLIGSLPVSFGCISVAEIVVDPGSHLVSFTVMLGMQWNRCVHVFQGSLPVRRGQERVSAGAVPVAHVVGWIKFYRSGGVVDG